MTSNETLNVTWKNQAMLCYQSWHEINQDLTPVMLPILTWEKTWVESSIKKLGVY